MHIDHVSVLNSFQITSGGFGENYYLFVVHHVGTAWLDTHDTLVDFLDTSNVSRCDVTSQVEFGLKPNDGMPCIIIIAAQKYAATCRMDI